MKYLNIPGFGPRDCYIDDNHNIVVPGLEPYKMSLEGNIVLQTIAGKHTLEKDVLTNNITAAVCDLISKKGKPPVQLCNIHGMTGMEIDARQSFVNTLNKIGLKKMAVYGGGPLMAGLAKLGLRILSGGIMRYFDNEQSARDWLAE